VLSHHHELITGPLGEEGSEFSLSDVAVGHGEPLSPSVAPQNEDFVNRHRFTSMCAAGEGVAILRRLEAQCQEGQRDLDECLDLGFLAMGLVGDAGAGAKRGRCPPSVALSGVPPGALPTHPSMVRVAMTR